MKKLEVTTLFQKKNSDDYGPVSVLMVLKYFGVEFSENELNKLMTYGESGTSIYDNGLRFLEQGLRVNLITSNPTVFPKEMQGKLRSKESLIKFLDTYQKNKPKRKEQTKLFKDFVRQGGKATIEIPTFEHVKNGNR